MASSLLSIFCCQHHHQRQHHFEISRLFCSFCRRCCSCWRLRNPTKITFIPLMVNGCWSLFLRFAMIFFHYNFIFFLFGFVEDKCLQLAFWEMTYKCWATRWMAGWLDEMKKLAFNTAEYRPASQLASQIDNCRQFCEVFSLIFI